jgi:hypothetical protein
MIRLDSRSTAIGLWSQLQVRVPSSPMGRPRPWSRPAASDRALGAMRARWYAASNWKFAGMRALKERLDFDDGKGASTLLAGRGLIMSHAIRDARGNTGS